MTWNGYYVGGYCINNETGGVYAIINKSEHVLVALCIKRGMFHKSGKTYSLKDPGSHSFYCKVKGDKLLKLFQLRNEVKGLEK